jgi:hypothetical protein
MIREEEMGMILHDSTDCLMFSSQTPKGKLEEMHYM